MDTKKAEFNLLETLDSRTIENNNDSRILDLIIDATDLGTLSTDETRQVALELRMRSIAKQNYLDRQEKLVKTGQAGKDASYIKLKSDYIPDVVDYMEEAHNKLKSEVDDSLESSSPTMLYLVDKFASVLSYETLAFIGFEKLLGSLDASKGSGYECILVKKIAEALDFEAFMTYVQNIDPGLLVYIGGYDLQSSTDGSSRKFKAIINRASKFNHLEWDFLEEQDAIRLGYWVMQAVIDSTDLFESHKIVVDEKKTQYMITLTTLGLEKKNIIQESITSEFSENYPMICPPLPWVRGSGKAGGYITPGPRSQRSSIHNHAGTIPSQNAIDAINRLQEQPFRVNNYILDIQLELLKRNIEIGTFRAFTLDHYNSLYPLILDEEADKVSWEDALDDPDMLQRKKDNYRKIMVAKNEERTSSLKAMPCERTISIANSVQLIEVGDLNDVIRFRDEPRIYTPWFFDNRLRMYPVVDTLNPQGSDYAKSLIEFADGVPVSENSKNELLVSIATCFGNDIDKQSFEKRIAAAVEMSSIFKKVVDDPLNKTSMNFWTKADEPFQFLALIHEYVKVFIDKTQVTHHVSGGRDATCSGIQIAGALLRDQRTMHLVNVTPSSSPQDAYRAVAEEAVKLIQDKDWLDAAIEKREAARTKKAERIIREQTELVREGKREEVTYKYEPRFECNIELDKVDRSVAKMIVMLTPYGGSYQTMLRHVEEKMRKKGSEMVREDYTILTHALIQGMATALPGFSALNTWFRTLAKTVMSTTDEFTGKKINRIVWYTPNGSLIVQQYFEYEKSNIKTFAHGQVNIRPRSFSTSTKAKSLKERKMMTALAANTIHSLDACIIQLAIADYKDSTFAAVHDCIYAPSGALFKLTARIRKAFLNTVTSKFLEGMIEENDLNDNELITTTLNAISHDDPNDVINSVLESQYLFS